MYPLGNQFIIEDNRSKALPGAVVQGNNFRISILSERLIRLEFSPSGTFVDRPTELVIRRDFGLAEFKAQQDPYTIQIISRYFTLTYLKNKPFTGTANDPAHNLRITLNSHEPERCKDWFYGNPEVRNLEGNMVGVDVDLPFNARRGLFSLDGFASIDDSNHKLIMEDGTLADPPKDHIDIYVFMYDHDFNLALSDYFKMTGSPSLIPRYALGNWWSRNTDYTDEKLDELIDKFERKRIPLSVLLLDNDWHYRNIGKDLGLKTGFTFNNNLIKDPVKLIDKCHERGIRFGLVVNPEQGFYPHEYYYKNAAQIMGLDKPTIIKFDPLNPKLLDVYFKIFLHPLEAYGIDFFWNDYKGSPKTTDSLWALNHYMFLDSKRDQNRRGMLLARSGLVAPHRYGILYGGSSEISWDSLKKLPFMYLNASNMGVSWWSHDVAGNHGGIEDPELYLRYLELSVFSPILRFHGARGPYYKKEPWLWDAKTEYIAADYLRLRHRLIPYLYTEAYNYTKSGIPLIQPFYYNYMWVYDDSSYKNEYYFGSQLLVSPILDNKDPVMERTIHRFFIPDGTWYDFITGKKFPGNKKYVSFFRDEDYPVFAHAGSIIPLSNRSDYNNTGLPTDLEIQIFPGVSNTYTLYEDDGVTSLYKEGYFLKTSIDYNYLKNNYTVIIRSVEGKSGIVPEKRNYKMVFRNTKLPSEISVYFNQQMIQVSGHVEGPDFVLNINDCPTVGQLTINCKGKDIEIDAARLINDDVNNILMDLRINTYLKEEIANIMFGDLPVNKKRIAIRKLRKKKLSKDYVALFIRLIEYIDEV